MVASVRKKKNVDKFITARHEVRNASSGYLLKNLEKPLHSFSITNKQIFRASERHQGFGGIYN